LNTVSSSSGCIGIRLRAIQSGLNAISSGSGSVSGSGDCSGLRLGSADEAGVDLNCRYGVLVPQIEWGTH
jgi:hypothetical protein